MKKMPVVFVGHGSPMNAIENNPYTAEWEALGQRLSRPKAILSISAHWFTPGTRVMDTESPRMIYDMYGFPDELYRIVYAAPGAPDFARRTQELLGENAAIDNSWGLDHGTWSVLHRVFPKAGIPVFQLSVDQNATPEQHFALGRALAPLREEGVLILGSGSVVHNLTRVDWHNAGGDQWAEAFDRYIYDHVLKRDYDNVVHFERAGESAWLAFYSIDHFAPLLYVLGASADSDCIAAFNNSRILGALSMTSYLFE
ncbi:MAG TPA: 4,5-DOPA dioxygenase extradiol [Clostridia bacterium]|nr:4,5-DOPA dioxygenase extradiol [Clostridia bacterium]